MTERDTAAATAAYTAKQPFVTKDQLASIAGHFPTPFHLYDEAGICNNIDAIHEAFAWNPGFKEYFAVKANPNPALIKLLTERGCGLDCSSATELMIAEGSGVTGHNIMFSSNDTPAADFALARELGAIVNFDDITHIPFFEQVAGPIPRTVSCRFNPGGLFRLANGIMDNPGDSKYGMTEEQLFEAFRMLKDRGAEEFGIHAFLASNTVTNDYYPALARILFELAVRLERETGAHVVFVNLSGGVGIPYRPGETPNDIRAIGEGVRRAFEEILVPAGMGDVSIFTEMGRFVMGPYGCLVTRALHEKRIYKDYIGVDACAADLMRPAMYGAYHHITVVGQEGGPDKSRAEATRTYDVTGGLCENNDKFAIDRELPEVEIGDLLVIHDAGAHGHSMGYNYNARLRSAEVLLHRDGSCELIRRAETPLDYLATVGVTDAGRRVLTCAERHMAKTTSKDGEE
ncbi:diaminopimelate decarboxylase [Collinsella sp. An307]|uniref:diaminopimelate decarboxylase n=1 Tax=Collinsella sp. An307 TaxID=1965630 RepID=UPI000B3996C0|nr:diaminopimelate decarboxylase [Collinsella sp. An307]OUO22404.1 diaminopimelate decarboxylase [Collinsella sp. An307]